MNVVDEAKGEQSTAAVALDQEFSDPFPMFIKSSAFPFHLFFAY